MKFIIFLIVTLLVSGCGYVPSAKFSRAVVGEKISTSVNISLVDPENTVIIKDAVDAAVIKVFHASLVLKEHSDTHLVISLSDPSYSPIQYDGDGFIVAYRSTVSLNIQRTTKDVTKNYVARGTYDFSVAPNAVITDKERFDAIRFSSEKAINAFVAQVSAEGSKQNAQSTFVPESPFVKENSSKVDQPKSSIDEKLDEISEAYDKKAKGLISEEEFKAIKVRILGK